MLIVRLLSILRRASTGALILVCVLVSRSDLQDLTVHQTDFLLREISEAHLASGGRLTSMPYPSGRIANSGLSTRLSGILARNNDGSVLHRRVLSLLYILDGQFDRARSELIELSLELPDDAGIHNDLGIVQTELAVSNPKTWLDALNEFEKADALRPDFPEAKFNLILAYRHLGLNRLLAATTDQYKKIEPNPSWRSLVGSSEKPRDDGESRLKRFEAASQEEVSELVRRYPSNVRRLVLKFAFRPALPIPWNYECAADELSKQYGDETAKAALAGLSTDDVGAIIRMRNLVDQARKLYLRGRLPESRTLYDGARQIAAHTNSVFDRVWVEINAADVMQVSFDYSHASALYRDAIDLSLRNGLKWLSARALSSFGATPVLSGGVINAIAHSGEAFDLFRQIGETAESARPLYFLAAYHSIAGSYDESLRFATECLKASEPGDHLHLAEADLIVSRDLNVLGQSSTAIHFAEEAADHSVQLYNPQFIARAKIELASAYLEGHRRHDAAAQLQEAEELLPRMSDADRESTEMPLNVNLARVAILSGNFQEAETRLRRNIKFRSEQTGVDVIRDYGSRISLAEALAAQGRNSESAAEVRKAVEFVEIDQDNLPKDALQISFDHDRRLVYDSAVRLTYEQSGCQEAWNLTQQYKAKLFLNSMQGFGPSPGSPGFERLTLDQVQRRIPNAVQIVDYMVLRDELLVWVISKNSFQCESVPVTVAQLQQKVALFVSQLLSRQPSDKAGHELYDVLVQPIHHLLEPSHVVVIVPDGILYRLPFPGLPSREGQYWIETTTIAETPSVTYLLSGEDQEPSRASHVAFGSRRYDALTNAELNTIRRTDAPLHLHSGPEVTKDSFLKALHDSSLVYYAGHSAFDMRNVLQSSILLDGDKPGPNSVSALDIMQQRISRNALILLSSCETSLGNATDGAGIGGLTSAFLLGGAGAVVGSLWPVESASTMQLMSGAFDSLIRQRKSPAESLRAAQIALIQNPATRHPYYWSGFAVTGNGSAIRP
jgi:CHAT domain-containing protein